MNKWPVPSRVRAFKFEFKAFIVLYSIGLLFSLSCDNTKPIFIRILSSLRMNILLYINVKLNFILAVDKLVVDAGAARNGH